MVRALRVLPLALVGPLLTGGGDAYHEHDWRDRPSLCLTTEEDGGLLRAHLVLSTEVPVTRVRVWLRFDHDTLALRDCAPGEMMHVSGCVVHLDAEPCERGCTIEARVLDGAFLIGRGELMELAFAVLGKEPKLRIRRVEFDLADDVMLRGGARPDAGDTETASWASVKSRYR